MKDVLIQLNYEVSLFLDWETYGSPGFLMRCARTSMVFQIVSLLPAL